MRPDRSEAGVFWVGFPRALADCRLCGVKPAIGGHRFRRDLGHAIGALGLGLAASLIGAAQAVFRFAAISMFVSGGEPFWPSGETHPRFDPASPREFADA